MAVTNHPFDLTLRHPGDQLALGTVVATSVLVYALGGPGSAPHTLAPLYRRHARGD